MNKSDLVAAIAEKAEMSKKDRDFQERFRKSTEGF